MINIIFIILISLNIKWFIIYNLIIIFELESTFNNLKTIDINKNDDKRQFLLVKNNTNDDCINNK